jgi:hemoglobin
MDPLPAQDTAHPWGDEETPYAAVGGGDGVRRLVEAFYDRIDAESPNLRAMLPRDDSGSRQKLFEYLSGWLGGPNLYVEKRGHPRLRMRHFPFPIGELEAAEWMRCMRLAFDDAAVPEPARSFFNSRLEPLAMHMVNR